MRVACELGARMSLDGSDPQDSPRRQLLPLAQLPRLKAGCGGWVGLGGGGWWMGVDGGDGGGGGWVGRGGWPGGSGSDMVRDCQSLKNS